MDAQQLRAIPGVGKDLAAQDPRAGRHRHVSRIIRSCSQSFRRPSSTCSVCRASGPKTVATALLDAEHLDARRSGGRRRGGPSPIAQRNGREEGSADPQGDRGAGEGRRPAPADRDSGDGCRARRRTCRVSAPDVEFIPVGSLRRGCETCGDIDILAVGGDATLMDVFVAHPRVERVLGQGDHQVQRQAGRRLPGRPAAGAAREPRRGHAVLHRLEGAQHRRPRPRHPARLQAERVRPLPDRRPTSSVAGETEEGIYRGAGHGVDRARAARASRRDRGRGRGLAAHARRPSAICAAICTCTPPRPTAGTTSSRMAAAAHRLGHQYIAITDHSQALAMANGLDERRALEHAARVRALNGRFEGLTLLAGIECDILADGRLDLADDCLAQLDLVVASVHSHFTQDAAADDRPHPARARVPVGRRARPSDRPPAAQARAGADGHGGDCRCRQRARRGDGDQLPARASRSQRRPRAAGPRPRRVVVISTDAHSVAALDRLRWGVQMARRAWVRPEDVLNTRGLDDFRSRLRRHRRPLTWPSPPPGSSR